MAERDAAYQLDKYVRTLLPTLALIVGAETPKSPTENVCLRQSGGESAHDIDRQDVLFQFISSYFSQTKAYSEIMRVYNILRNRLSVLLPTATVDGIVYPAVTAWRIVAMQMPGYIGADEKGRHQWSVNFLITLGS
jgi:hypothetical protein